MGLPAVAVGEGEGRGVGRGVGLKEGSSVGNGVGIGLCADQSVSLISADARRVGDGLIYALVVASAEELAFA